MIFTILGAILFSLLAVALLSVGLFIGTKKKIPTGHIHDSLPMKERGITCAQDQMRAEAMKKSTREKMTEYNH